MSRPSAIDVPVMLGDLLGRGELREVAGMYRELHGVDVSIAERAGALVVTTARDHDAGAIQAALAGAGDAVAVVPGAAPDTALTLRPMMYEGRHLATVAIGPYRERDVATAEAAAEAAGREPGAPALDGARADAVARHLVGMLEVLAHHAHARFLTSTLHSEAMQETFTELAAKNERLEQAVEHMQEVDRLKSSFLATVSHELRTPLTSVIGYAEMLYEGLAGPLNKEQRDYMQTILNKADQLLQLITTLLEASILESGSVPMQREPIAMRQLIERVLSGLGPRARARRIEVRDMAPALPRALGDARKIRQVLRNLLANAVKFTADDALIEITVRVGPLSRHADPGSEPGLRVTVSDAGIGIPPENHELIFEPFFQVDSSSTRRYGGTGLGLTLAKSYIEANGGNIWVQSAPGQGSTFTFSIPAVPEDLERFLAAEREP